MKLSQIVYPIIKPLVALGITVYHRNIFFSNAHRIPKDQPVLLISNHPTAFLEPVICASLLDRQVHSLVRGDFFQNWAAKTGLESLNLIPIYRMRDGGVKGLRKNASTFGYCYDLLASNKQVLIMAEGFTKQQKRLAPLQKGAARIAFGAATARELDNLLIIPLGANFTAANRFRGEVMIEVGKPISITKYLQEYQSDKKSAIDSLTLDMADAMRKTIVHIDCEKDDELFERLVPIVRRKLNSTLWPFWNRTSARFNLEKKLADYINELDVDKKEDLSNMIRNYPDSIYLRSKSTILNNGILIIGYPFWLAGCIYRFIPFFIAREIVTNKVSNIEFESPIRLGMGLLFFTIWSLLVLLVLIWSFGISYVWLPFFMIFVVWFSVIYQDLKEVVQHSTKWNKQSIEQQAMAIEIESQLFKLMYT